MRLLRLAILAVLGSARGQPGAVGPVVQPPSIVYTNMLIPPGAEFVLPASPPVLTLGTVTVQGTLRCPTAASFRSEIVVDSVEVMAGGLFECGTPADPVRGKVEIRLQGDSRAVRVHSGGGLELHGAPGREGWVRLGRMGSVGNQTLTIRDGSSFGGATGDISGWQAGDRVVVATTGFHRQTEDQWLDPNAERLHANEVFTLVDVDAPSGTITLDAPLQYEHYGGEPQRYFGGQWTLDESAYLVNLERTITVSAADSTLGSGGGEVKALFPGASMRVSRVELSGLGVAGALGRYPFHWHKVGDDGRGQYIEGCSVHSSQNRCIVVHGTNFATVRGNTCFDFFGHGLFLEDGDERGNTLDGNIAIVAKKPQPQFALLESDLVDVNIQRFPAPSGIWISRPYNRVINNVAIASEGTGIWMAFVSNLCCTPFAQCSVTHPPETCEGTLHQPFQEDTLAFDGNVAASCVVGMNWDGVPIGESTNNINNPFDKKIKIKRYQPISGQVPVFRNNTVYKASRSSLYTRTSAAVFDRLVMADGGWGPLYAYNNVLRNSLNVGWSANAEADFAFDPTVRAAVRPFFQPVSAFAYDGPWVFESMAFAGYPVERVTHTKTSFNQPVARDVTPRLFNAVGAADRFANLMGAAVKYEADDLFYDVCGPWRQAATIYKDVYKQPTGVVTFPGGTLGGGRGRNLRLGGGTGASSVTAATPMPGDANVTVISTTSSTSTSTTTTTPFTVTLSPGHPGQGSPSGTALPVPTERYTITGPMPFNYDEASCTKNTFRQSDALLCSNYEVSFLEAPLNPGGAFVGAVRRMRFQRSLDGRPCDWDCYHNRYDDVPDPMIRPVGGSGNPFANAAAQHYFQVGSKEGRDCTCDCDPVTECPQWLTSGAINRVQFIRKLKGVHSPMGTNPYRYHITHLDARQSVESFGFRANEEGSLSPAIYVNYGPYCEDMEVRSAATGAPFPTAASEQEVIDHVDNNGGNLVFYDTLIRKLVLRVEVDEETQDTSYGFYPGSPSAYTGQFELVCGTPSLFGPLNPTVGSLNFTDYLTGYVQDGVAGQAQVFGQVAPGGTVASGTIVAKGFACVVNDPEPIEVVLVSKQDASNTVLHTVLANETSNEAAAAECRTTTPHGFTLTFDVSAASLPLGTEAIEVKGVGSPGVHVNIENSGPPEKTLFIEDISTAGLDFETWLAQLRAQPSSGYTG